MERSYNITLKIIDILCFILYKTNYEKKIIITSINAFNCFMWMWQKKHNLDENFRYDETSHWKWCYVDVENDGYIYVKVAISQDAITGGSWYIYNSDKELINVGAPYETY